MSVEIEKIASIINDISTSNTRVLSLFDKLYRRIKNDEEKVLKLFKIIASHNVQRAAFLYLAYMQRRNWVRDDEVADYLVNTAVNKAKNGIVYEHKLKINIEIHIAIQSVLVIVASKGNTLPEDPFYPMISDILSDESKGNTFVEKCRNIIWYFEELGETMVPVYTTKLLQNLEKISDSIRPKKVFARYSITVSDEYPASVTGYVYEKYKAKDYPSLQYLLKLFPGITFETLGCDLNSFIEDFRECTPSEIMPAVICAGILSENSKEQKEYINLINKDIAFTRIYASLYAVKNGLSDGIEPVKQEQNECKEFVSHLEDIEIETFRFLLSNAPGKILDLLKSLGDANFYKPGINNRTIESATERQTRLSTAELTRLSEYYNDDELTYIYLNSHIRYYVPIQTLFGIMYSRSNYRDDQAMYLSGNYRFQGKLVREVTGQGKSSTYINTNSFLSEPRNIRIRGNVPDQTKDVKFYLGYYQIVDGFNPVAVIERGKTIDELYNMLNRLNKDLDGGDVDFTNNRFLFPHEFTGLGMKIIDILISCHNNSQRTDLLKKIKNNPFHHKFSQNDHYIRFIGSMLSADEKNRCNTLMNQITREHSGYGKRTGMVIFTNTLLRFVFNIDEFTDRLCSKEPGKNPDPLYFNPIRGIVLNVEDNVITADPESVHISGDGFIRIPTGKNNLPDIKTGDYIGFNLSSYDTVNRKINWEKPILYNDRFDRYYLAMNKAGQTLDLSGRDKYILSKGEYRSNKSKGLTSKLALAEVSCINLRINDRDRLISFVDMVKPGNPWGTKSINELSHVQKENNRDNVCDVLFRLIDYHNIDDALYVYFNTSLKAYGLLEYLARELSNRYDRSVVKDAFSRYGVDSDKVLAKSEKQTDYFQLGEYSRNGDKHDYEKAIGYYQKSIELNDRKRGSVIGIIECMIKLQTSVDEPLSLLEKYNDEFTDEDKRFWTAIILASSTDSKSVSKLHPAIDSVCHLKNISRILDCFMKCYTALYKNGFYKETIDVTDKCQKIMLDNQDAIKENRLKKTLRFCRTYKLKSLVMLDMEDEATELALTLSEENPDVSGFKKLLEAADPEQKKSIVSERSLFE